MPPTVAILVFAEIIWVLSSPLLACPRSQGRMEAKPSSLSLPSLGRVITRFPLQDANRHLAFGAPAQQNDKLRPQFSEQPQFVTSLDATSNATDLAVPKDRLSL